MLEMSGRVVQFSERLPGVYLFADLCVPSNGIETNGAVSGAEST